MYFLSLDTLHVIVALVFVVTSLALVYFRAGKHIRTHGKMTNYTVRKGLLLVRIVALGCSLVLLGLLFLKPI